MPNIITTYGNPDVDTRIEKLTPVFPLLLFGDGGNGVLLSVRDGGVDVYGRKMYELIFILTEKSKDKYSARLIEDQRNETITRCYPAIYVQPLDQMDPSLRVVFVLCGFNGEEDTPPLLMQFRMVKQLADEQVYQQMQKRQLAVMNQRMNDMINNFHYMLEKEWRFYSTIRGHVNQPSAAEEEMADEPLTQTDINTTVA